MNTKLSCNGLLMNDAVLTLLSFVLLAGCMCELV